MHVEAVWNNETTVGDYKTRDGFTGCVCWGCLTSSSLASDGIQVGVCAIFDNKEEKRANNRQ